MKKRKNTIEYGIHVHINQANLVQEDSLALIDTLSNVYIICKRRRICLKPDPVFKNVYNFFVKNNDEYCNTNISFLLPRNQTLDIKYPYTKCIIINNTTDQSIEANTSILLCNIFRNNKYFDECKSYYNKRNCDECSMYGTCYHKCLDLEVIYIGQSFNSNTRLSSAHETLQKINSDILLNEPDHEVWIILLSDFIVKLHTTLADGEYNNFNKFALNPDFLSKFDKKEIINLVEAGLINYFKPLYNNNYKYSFPSKNHKSYPLSYKYNVNALTIELNTSYVLSRTYSNEVPESTLHLPIFQLFDKQYKNLYEF